MVDHQGFPRKTRILFVTEGILLRRLESDPEARFAVKGVDVDGMFTRTRWTAINIVM